MKTKRKILSVLIALCLVIGTMPPVAMTVLAADGEPALSADGYYEIATADELYWFANEVNSGNNAINGRLVANIVINENVLTTDGKLNGDGGNFRQWTPIGNDTNKYSGIFDGQNHTISGIYINNDIDNSQPKVGFFGYANEAEIENLGVIDGYIKGKSSIGGLCGYFGKGTIINCYNTCTIFGGDNIGGVCGESVGDIIGCYNSGVINGYYNAGGVCGYSRTGNIMNSYNSGSVNDWINDYAGYFGGICADKFRGKIENCYNYGKVKAATPIWLSGGICGLNQAIAVINSYYLDKSAVLGIGDGPQYESTAKTAEEFASGEVAYLLNGSTSEGDLAWRQNIENYAEPADASPVLDPTHAIVKFDGTSYYNDCTHTKYEYGFCTNCGAYQPAVLNGDTYEIGNAGQLYWFAALVNGDKTHADFDAQNAAANAKLTADIVINENVLTADGELNGDGSNFRAWTPIGKDSNSYDGTFDGQNHTISGLYFNDDTRDYVGLFGFAYIGSEIKNVGVIDSYLKGNYYVGGVCGRNGGTIENCYNAGVISSHNNYVGGVCASNYGPIENCYNTGSVSGNARVGGVCGYNYATITNCYYLEGSAAQGLGNSAGEATSKTAEQFASGEVAYLLNGSTSEGDLAWRQNIENYAEPADAYPVLDPTHAIVKFDGTSYYNDCTHTKYDNGFCTACGQYQPAVLNGDTYEIGNAGQLYWFAALVNGDNTHADFDAQNTSANAKLTADIVINENVLTADGELNGDGSNFRVWTPIGKDSNSYDGTFDGQNHTVSGLYFNDNATNYVGLFGFAYIGSEIKNVGVIDSYLKGNYYVGGVCGRNGGTIENCYNAGTVKGGNNVGGVCGSIGGYTAVLTDCYNSGAVSGNNKYVGGVCGQSASGVRIEKCHNSGTVSGYYYVGGVCGYDGGGIITDCYNTGTVSGTGDYVGGVCGQKYSEISNCYNTGAVSGAWEVGGLCGYVNGTVANCYNQAAVNGTWYVGGLCGYVNGTVANCYNQAAVNGTWYVGGICGYGDSVGVMKKNYNSGTVIGTTNVGGLCGSISHENAVTACYYLDTCGAGGVGTSKTAEQFQSGEVCYLLNGDQTNPVFKQTVGTDNFPSFNGSTLYAVTFVDYAGTEENAFVYGNEGGAVTIPATYNTGYTFKDSAGSFVTPITVFGKENVTYTAIPAPTYTVTIPESTTLDETNVDDTSGDYVKTGFDVSAAAKWLAGNGKTLTVTVESANGYQMKASGVGTGVPYTYTAGTTAFTADNKTVLTLTGDNETKTASGTLKVNKADVIYAGTFTDILTFTIALKQTE